MTIKYEVGKTYQLTNGGQGVIGYVFGNGSAYGIYSRDDVEDYVTPMKWDANGVSDWGDGGKFNIIPPPPETVTLWVNVGRNATARLYIRGEHDTREQAEAHSGEPRVGCHRITLRAEFEEDNDDRNERAFGKVIYRSAE